MTIQPGQGTTLSMQFMMHGEMGGRHLFRVSIKSNDPSNPAKALYVRSNWIP